MANFFYKIFDRFICLTTGSFSTGRLILRNISKRCIQLQLCLFVITRIYLNEFIYFKLLNNRALDVGNNFTSDQQMSSIIPCKQTDMLIPGSIGGNRLKFFETWRTDFSKMFITQTSMPNSVHVRRKNWRKRLSASSKKRYFTMEMR